MKKKKILVAAIIAAVQISTVDFPGLTAVAWASPAPDWSVKALDELVAAGVFDVAEGGMVRGGTLSREEAAVLVARAIVKMEAGGVSLTPYEGAPATKPTTDNRDDTTLMLERLEGMEDRRAKELQFYRDEYTQAEADIDIWATKLAGAELTNASRADVDNFEMKYQQAVQRLGEAVRKLEQAEIGDRDRKAYIGELKDKKIKGAERPQGTVKINSAQQGQYTSEQKALVEQLRGEFSQELADMGYGAVELARKTPKNDTPKFKVSGEVRYNYASNDGPRPTVGDDSRLRTRLYMEAQINKEWSAHSLLESDKSFLQGGKRDGFPNINRFYVQGKMKNALVTAGSFGYLIAEGNVYDSRFKGAVVEFGDPVKVRVGWGSTNDNGNGYLASASYKTSDYNVEGGFYHYEDDAAQRDNTIFYVGGNYSLERYTLGAMYLRSSLADSKGNRDGYVLTLGYGALKTWKPGTYNMFLKYYNQSRGTYIAHTMSGPAGYMQGFKGYGAGYYYTIAPNLVYGIEYYMIRDKVTGENGRTFWNQISYYF